MEPVVDGVKTGYSRSSWERYLNGKALAPRQAVEELARVNGVETTRAPGAP
ncbi:helix-turn-helix domain-containing protein [Streptomyces sp. GbtcB7]|uniref:helix-turn-helix domain-containing protein n=1 Tax=Streptomyces sp. GbtcB7 TaxID=2824752 RepID=UPI0034D57923